VSVERRTSGIGLQSVVPKITGRKTMLRLVSLLKHRGTEFTERPSGERRKGGVFRNFDQKVCNVFAPDPSVLYGVTVVSQAYR